MSEPDPFKICDDVISLWRDYMNERDIAKEKEAENARLKAEVERLTKAVKFNFPGGDQLLADLSKLLTAHRHYCDINAIDYSKMEKDALNAAKKGGQP